MLGVLLGSALACKGGSQSTGGAESDAGFSVDGDVDLTKGDVDGQDNWGAQDTASMPDGAVEVDTGSDLDVVAPDAFDADADADEHVHGGAPPLGGCGPIVDLGPLRNGIQNLRIDFSDRMNFIETSCSNANVASGEAVYSFTIVDQGSFKVRSSSPVAIELRTEPCERRDRILICAEEELDLQLNFSPLVYHLVFEPLVGSQLSEVDIEIEFELTPQCENPGAARCIDGEVIEKCDYTRDSPDIPRLTVESCPAECQGNRCRGDSCGRPFVVTEDVSIVGNGQLLYNEHSHSSETCREGSADPMVADAREFVLELPNLVAGDVVSIATEESFEDHRVAIKSSCNDVAACVATWQSRESTSWVVPEDGTYYVFIENASPVVDVFVYTVEIRRN